MINKIRNNTISEIAVKKNLNTLNELKNAEMIKQKTHTPNQKELLNFFNDLSDTILTDKTLESKSQKDDENVNENEETLMSLNEDDESKIEDDDETMSQSKITKELNDHLEKIIDQSKSFEEQMKSLKKREDLKGF